MATVLIVEDNRDNQEIYRAVLEHLGHRVLQAWNGIEGVQAAHEYRPDAVVMDVTMPLMDGLEATRQLKSDPATRPIPILILTAHALPSDRADAVAAGCDAYMAKPAEPMAVAEQVRTLIEGERA